MSTRILFVCTGNRARSQMAEGLARALAGDAIEVASAGTEPHPQGLHPLAIEVLRERGIDISRAQPKRIGEVPGEFDYVITLCTTAAQNCPVLPARHARLHWSLPDPVLASGDRAEQLAFFRSVRDDIERRLREWMRQEGLLRER